MLFSSSTAHCTVSYSFCSISRSAGGLVTHWDASSPWAQLQLVSACHGPVNTVLLLTAARVLYVVGYANSSSAGSRRGDATAGQQQQQLLEKHSVKVGFARLRQ